MRFQKRILFRACIVVLALLAASAMFTRNKVEAVVSPGVAPANPTCYPSCPPNDARFFSLAGSNLFTFAGGTTTIGLRVRGAGTPANFTVGIFDGDTNASGAGLWDQNTMASAQQTTFDLFADANNDGVEDGAALEQLPGASMLDNAWAYFNVPTHAAAFNAALGDYFYLLKVSLVPPFAGLVQNNFKVLADSNQTQLFITPQVLSFQAFQNIAAEFLIIHPSGNVDEVQPSNYNGIWNFSFLVDPTAASVNVFDGDLDIGSVGAGSTLDRDDLTTPNFTPDNAAFGTLAFTQPMTAGINPEGVGTTNVCVNPQAFQACPPDDSVDNRFRRRSSIAGAGVVTRLIPPAGTTFTNNNPADIQVAAGGTSFVNINPSGTNEWELLRVGTNAGPLAALNDVTVPTLDLLPGAAPELWTYQIEGMDLANLFALRFDRILLVEPFMIGDTVFCDADKDGVQDPAEVGRAGVLVELLDSVNNVLKTTTTNASGFYSFVVEPGIYTVRIAASNFAVGGALEGLTSTTGGNQKTDTVVNANVLTYDFGYDCAPVVCKQTIGDLVWEDKDGDGFRDAGEPGIAGVVIDLLVSTACDGVYVDLPGNAVTNAAGFYSFTDLPQACYRVQVNDPDGFVKTNGAPGVNNNSQTNPYDIDLDAEECTDNLTADFGYIRQCDCDLGLVDIIFYYDEFKLKIKNEGLCDAVLTDISIAFPSGNGKLNKVLLGSAIVADPNPDLASPAVIGSGGLTAVVASKTIKPGETKLLIFDFVNNAVADKTKYTVTVKFGDCIIQLIPPPVNCECKVKTWDISWNCDVLKWTVKNEGQCDVALTNFNLSFPSVNGKLDWIKLGTNLIYSTPDLSSPANIPVGSLGPQSGRTIKPGEMKTFYIDFYNNASTDKSKYTGALKFGDCEVKFPTPPAENCDCTKIKTVKYKVYNGTLQWTLKNEGTCDIRLTYLNFDWIHDYNGKLTWIKLDQTVIWDGTDVYSPWSYSWGTSGPKIGPGLTKTLTFDFVNSPKNEASSYTGYIKFGTCQKNFPSSFIY